MAKAPSRAKRWAEAVSKLSSARDKMAELRCEADDAFSDLRDIQSEFQEWLDNLPENLASSPLGEKLDAVTQIDLDWSGDLDDLEERVSECEGADLPLGFGRD